MKMNCYNKNKKLKYSSAVAQGEDFFKTLCPLWLR